MKESQTIVPDETGWRIGGNAAWLHVAVAPHAVCYLIAPQRGFEASKRLIGEDYKGKLIHDGYASYDRFTHAIHQTCLAHLLRRCRELLETATRGAVVFPRKVKALLQASLHVRERRDAEEITLKGARAAATRFDQQMARLLKPIKTNPVNERLARHLWKHRRQLFTFLRHPGVDATNHQAERAIRPAVVNRKVWGGNRTEAGATAQAILMTVLFTAANNQTDALQWLSQTLRRSRDKPMLLTG